MIQQRPHTLTFTWGDLTKDASGFRTAAPSGSFTGDCGIFPNLTSRTISVGGVALSYSYLITLDTDSDIPEGAKVTIEGKAFQVKRRMEWQKHAEVWV